MIIKTLSIYLKNISGRIKEVREFPGRENVGKKADGFNNKSESYA